MGYADKSDRMEEKRRKKHGRKVSVLTVTLTAIALISLFPAGIRLVEHMNQIRQQKQIAAKGINSMEILAANPEFGIIEIDGRKYRRNTAIRAILCIGVDTGGEMKVYHASGMAGQADGLFLVAQDMARDTVEILMIPRDTMTEITLLDLMGNELGKDVQHLTLAFGYGDGREKSCELLRDSVSELLCDLKIDGYIAMNTSTISLLNDEVGGVEVTVNEKGLDIRDPALTEGSTLRLNGGQAEIFVRYRDITKPQTAISRMARQKQYIKAYLDTAKTTAAKDKALITRLMNLVQEHMVTDMAKDQYLDMGLAVLNSQQSLEDSDFIMLPGEAVETELYDEYHPDPEAVKRTVVDLFYKEIR